MSKDQTPVREINFKEPLPFQQDDTDLTTLIETTKGKLLNLKHGTTDQPKQQENVNSNQKRVRSDIYAVIEKSIIQMTHVYDFIDLIYHHMGIFLPTQEKNYNGVLFRVPWSILDDLNNLKEIESEPIEETISNIFVGYYKRNKDPVSGVYALELFNSIEKPEKDRKEALFLKLSTLKQEFLSEFKEVQELSKYFDSIESECKMHQSKIGERIGEEEEPRQTSDKKVPPITHFGFIGVVPSFVEMIFQHYTQVLNIINNEALTVKDLLNNVTIRYRFAEFIAVGVQKKLCIKNSTQLRYYDIVTGTEELLKEHCFKNIVISQDASNPENIVLEYDDSIYLQEKTSFNENIKASKKRK